MAKLTTEYVTLETARIAYRRYGTGPILILLHGNSESKRIFMKYQVKHFRMFHTIAVDSRGHGQSQSNDEEYSIEQYSEDVIDMCNIKGIRSAYVIGYSDGGNISLLLAKKAPDLFKRIIAISPNYLASGTEEKTLKLFKKIVRIMQCLARLGFRLKKSIMRFNLLLNDIGITDDELQGIKTDMKILYAEKDLIKEEHIKHMASLIPNASVNKIKGCTHMTILNKKEAIDIMKSYLCEDNSR